MQIHKKISPDGLIFLKLFSIIYDVAMVQVPAD